MPRGPSYFESKGACIYCGATDSVLSDEHVVPYSLGGSHVLRKASCGRCADITKKFEQKVARDLWGDARVAFYAPSRRKSQREQKLNMLDPSGCGKELFIPAAEYPAGFGFYKMCQAGLLQGLPADVDVPSRWQLVIIDDDQRRKNFLTKYPTRKLSLSFRHVPQDFGRLLAKIGYGHVLTELVQGVAYLSEVVALIQAQTLGVLWARSWAWHRQAVHRRPYQLSCRGGWRHPPPAPRNTLGFSQQATFDAPLTAVRGVGAGFSPAQWGFGHDPVQAQPTPIQPLQFVIAFQSHPP